MSANKKDCKVILIDILWLRMLESCLEIIYLKGWGEYDQYELLSHYWKIQWENGFACAVKKVV